MKLKQKILLIALLPLLVLGIAITVVSNSEINKAMDETIQNGLRGTAISMRSTFRQLNNEPYMLDENGDLVKGDFNISEYTDMADEIKETANIDISIIYGDTRYMTSLLDSNGQRMTGTKADAATIEAVVGRGEELFVENTEVDGVAYYGYYIPLLDFTKIGRASCRERV